MTSLATLGDEAKIWEVPTFKVLELFNPYEGSVTDLTWSHDGHAIACCSSSDTTVHVRSTKVTLSVPSQSFQLPSECSCLDFNSESRFLLCGCVDGSLHLYDQKSKSISKSYMNQKSPVTSVRWNWNNNCIAAGAKNGEIILFNIVSNQASSPLVTQSIQAIQQLKYNPYKKAMLVATSDDGAVNLWDTNTRRLIRNFDKTHHASAKDVAFSPINDIFMVSVGLDKRAVFYDIQSKTSIKTIVADQPLTCVDVLHDGATVAVGTIRGQVLLYDMRQSSTPVFSFPAHRSSVKRLSFVRKEPRKGDSTSSSHSISESLRRQLPVSPGESNLMNGSSAYHSPRTTLSKSDVDIISPLAYGNKSNNSIPDPQWNDRPVGHVSFDAFASDSVGGATHELFSPVKMDNSLSMNSTGGDRAASILGSDSFLTKVLGSAENSLNKDFSHHSTKTRAIEGEENTNILRFTPKQPSPYRNSFGKEGLGSPVSHAVSPRETPASPWLAVSGRPQHHHSHHTVTFEDRPPHVLNGAEINGSASAVQASPRSRSQDSAAKHISPRISGSKMHSPPRALQRLDSPRAGDTAPHSLSQATASSAETAVAPIAGAVAASSSVNGSVTSPLRSIIQDLLHEQLQAHQADLHAEIRAMVTRSGVRQGLESSMDGDRLGSTGNGHRVHHPSPEVYQAEFIRNLVKDELCDLQDWMSEWFWAIKRDQIKTSMQLERMEAMLADACINPVLLQEIETLRAENAQLRKTF